MKPFIYILNLFFYKKKGFLGDHRFSYHVQSSSGAREASRTEQKKRPTRPKHRYLILCNTALKTLIRSLTNALK